MPLWTWEELNLCRIHCYPKISEEELLVRFNCWGSVVRWTLGEQSGDWKEEFENAVRHSRFDRVMEAIQAGDSAQDMLVH
eukprot:1089170-Rhodomonas_salina.1